MNDLKISTNDIALPGWNHFRRVVLEPMLSALYHFLTRYKLLHIAFWTGFCLLETAGVSVHHGKHQSFFLNFLGTLPGTVFYAANTYFVLYYLRPVFLNRRRFLFFLLLMPASWLVFQYIGFYVQQATWSAVEGKPLELRFFTIYLSGVIEAAVLSIAFLSLYLLHDYFLQRIRNEQLEKEKIRAELDFLHGQVNPHFLFNAINSVFVLIDENKDDARKCLHMFSEMLRYQLYDCRTEAVALSGEMRFIEHYLEIEKLRKADTTTIATDFRTGHGSDLIIPLLLTTFVENACKYVASNRHGENFIRVTLEDRGDEVVFRCVNSIHPQAVQPATTAGGIGIKNSQRRLSLSYPGRHTLQIEPGADEFNVTLSLKLQP